MIIKIKEGIKTVVFNCKIVILVLPLFKILLQLSTQSRHGMVFHTSKHDRVFDIEAELKGRQFGLKFV